MSMKIECKLFEIYPCIVIFYQYRGYNAMDGLSCVQRKITTRVFTCI